MQTIRKHSDVSRIAVVTTFAIAALLAALLAHYWQPAAAHAQDTCVIPDNPQNVAVTVGHEKLTLTWDEPGSWGSWGGEGYRRYYNIQWRRPGSNTWNTIGTNWSNQHPLTAYSFTGTYSERPNTGPSRNHTVTNGTAYELQIRAGATGSCGNLLSYYVQASGTPVESQGTLSDDATLSGLELANATLGSSAPAALGFGFTSNYEDYYARVLKEVTVVTVKPTATTGSSATIRVKLETGGTPQNVASGSVSPTIAITPKADLSTPHNIYVTVTAENGSDTKTYNIRVYQYEPLSFGTATISNMQFTVDDEVRFVAPPVNDNDTLDVSYTATGLPAGLSMQRRVVDGEYRGVISGTPEAATTEPVTVTYTATSDELGSSASLNFQVTVINSPVFDAEELRNFTTQTFSYTIGQTSPLTLTLPEASGGTGALTYRLDSGSPRGSISDIAGFSFDTGTRVLSVGSGGVEPSADSDHCAAHGNPQTCDYGLWYLVEDENGSTASATSVIEVSAAPSLAEIADQSFTVGNAVKISLPRSPHGSVIVGHPNLLEYGLEPELRGLSLDTQDLTLTGTAGYTGTTEMTYSVTDRNGVSASRTFTLTVASGANAPSSAPALTVSYTSGDTRALLEWGELAGATGYVIQVRTAEDSFPSQAVAHMTGRDGSNEYQTRSGDEGQIAYVHVTGLTDGTYTARVAGKNDDGAGPWSTEVEFTVQVGGL